jgi:hypothetical protein
VEAGQEEVRLAAGSGCPGALGAGIVWDFYLFRGFAKN